MHKLFRLAVILAVVVFSLALATPVLADGNGKAEYLVKPTIGGPNNPHTHYPPGAPTVNIPTNNPAIVDDQSALEPGDVFWPIDAYR